jgi:hypothetical protein
MKKGIAQDTLSIILGVIIMLVLAYVLITGVIQGKIAKAPDVIAVQCGTLPGQACIDASVACTGTPVPATTAVCPEAKKCCQSEAIS